MVNIVMIVRISIMLCFVNVISVLGLYVGLWDCLLFSFIFLVLDVIFVSNIFVGIVGCVKYFSYIGIVWEKWLINNKL